MILNWLAYYGTAPTYDTAPLLHSLNKEGVSNEALYTNATIALRPKTGELAWFSSICQMISGILIGFLRRQIVELGIGGNSRSSFNGWQNGTF